MCYNGLNQPTKVMELLELNLAHVVHKLEVVPMYVKLTLMQDVSRGLDYLHTRNPPIVHSYLTMGIILLTANLVAKIGGFTFSVEMVPKTKESIATTNFICGPPFDIYSFGWLICQTAIGGHWLTIHKIFHSRLINIGKPLTMHAVNDGQYEYYINQIENASLKQLVMNCMNDNPDLRPSASLITEMIGNMIKGKFISLSNNSVNTIMVTIATY